MAFDQLTSSAFLLYDEMLKEADPRVEDWPLMSSPFPQTVVILAYIYFVTTLGPRLMENRKPFDLKRPMIIYNISIVIFSLYMIYEFLLSGWANGYSYRCDLVDYSSSPQGLRMARACWLYYVSKFIELLDTVSSDFLCSEEEEQPGVIPPRLPSLHHVLHLVVRGQVRCRWSGNLPRPAELLRPRHHVHLLRPLCYGSGLPEVPVVEEAHDHHSADPVCDGDRSHRPVLLHEGLPVPVPRVPVRHRLVRHDLPGSVPQLLLPRLHQGQEAAQGAPERHVPPERGSQEGGVTRDPALGRT